MNKIILFLILIKVNTCSKILTFPFKLKFPKYNYMEYGSYTAFNFLKDNYKKDLIIEMNIGTPSQRIDIYVNSYSYCFEFKQSNSNSSSNYHPHQSSTFKINKNQQTNPFAYNKLIHSTDLFTFNKNESYNLSFVSLEKLNISSNKNISFIGEIGLNNQMTYLLYNYYSCNSLINDLKSIKAIDNKIFSFKFENKYHASFILGNDLFVYDPKYFKKEQYYTKYFVLDFSFEYDNIYMNYSWNKNEYLNITGNSKRKEAIINLNSGFIIGTEDFRNFIHKIFFKYLVDKRICSLDLVNFNESEAKFGNEFYVYSCNHMQFTGQTSQRHQTINYYSEFPNLVINSKSFEYDFEILKKDLFEQIYSRDYFLIIFPKNIQDNKTKDIWYLGEPFYKRYPFTINLDAKTIGFYLDKKIISESKLNVTEGLVKDVNNSNNNNSKVKDILIKIGEICLGIGLIILAYFIGIKVKEGRKKRANELKDDSYEYISEDNKDINNNENEQKNKQLVELNSKLGI